MGLPNINILFQKTATSAAYRSAKGVVAMILKDSTSSVQGGHIIKTASDIPAEMTNSNKEYIKQALIGNDNAPSKIIIYVLADSAENMSAATSWLSGQRFNWLVGPPDADSNDTSELVDWIRAQRAAGRKYMAVLPNTAADDMAIVNFCTDSIVTYGSSYSAPSYCARIAGLIAGTPLNSSITYAVLPEVTSVEQLSKSDMDKAINAGKLILLHDGKKVKVGRGVTSLTTTSGTLTQYQKIKIVEAVDLISEDITTLCEDNYIGKYANSYDNKLLLVCAIQNYFRVLESEGVLKTGSTVDIDVEATRYYLTNAGTDVSEMSDKEIREADTGDDVYLTAGICVLDAIENITLKINL